MNQESTTTPDQWTEGPDSFVYRDGNWTTPSGYCLSTARGHELTLKFYAQHGRVPFSPAPVKLLAVRRPKAAPRKADARTASPAEKPRSAAVRAAIGRALAAKAAGSAPATSPLGTKPRAKVSRAGAKTNKPTSSRARRAHAGQ